MIRQLVLAGIVAAVAPAVSSAATYEYFSYLDATGVDGSTSSATGSFYGAFPERYEPACRFGDNRFEFYVEQSGTECEVFRVQFEGRDDDDVRWSFHVPVEPNASGAEAVIDFPFVYCADLEEESGESAFVPVWVRLETDCNPKGEIGGQIEVIVGFPVETTSWGTLKARFE